MRQSRHYYRRRALVKDVTSGAVVLFAIAVLFIIWMLLP